MRIILLILILSSLALGQPTITIATTLEITPVVTTLAGIAYQQGSANGTGTAASFDHPHGVVVDASGNVYVGDTGNNLIRKIATTLASGSTTNNATLPLIFTTSKPTTDFAVGDISVTNGALSSFSATSSTVYTATFTPSSNGAVTINVAADRFTDAIGNPNTIATEFNWTYRTRINVPADYSTIQAAINAAVSGDTIYVAANTYNENIDINGKNISVLGEDRETTIIDAEQNGFRVVNIVNHGNLINLTIKNGLIAESSGSEKHAGGINVEHGNESDIKIINCIIKNNSSPNGFGGGLRIKKNASNVVNGKVTIKNSVFIDNSSKDPGAAIHVDSDKGIISIDNCFFSNNFSQGGVDLHAGWKTSITNSLILGSVRIGGNPPFYSSIINSTIIGSDQACNAGDCQTMALYINSQSQEAIESISISNSIIMSEGFAIGTFPSNINWSTVNMQNNCIYSPQNEDYPFDNTNLFINPLFVDSANGNYHLSDYSPCIGAGTATGAPTTDIEGNPRPNPAGSNPDIGAYEHANAEPVLDTDGPVPTISSTLTVTNEPEFTINIEFNELVTGFTVDDISVNNGAKTIQILDANWMGGLMYGSKYNCHITPTAEGTITVDIPAGGCMDIFNNTNVAATQFSITYDTTGPIATFSSTIDSITNVSPIPITITFNESVTGFEVDDLTYNSVPFSTVSFSAFSGSDNIYTVNVIPSSDGLLSIIIPDSTSQDIAGNFNVSSSFNFTYDTAGPTPIMNLSSDGPGTVGTSLETITLWVAYQSNGPFSGPETILSLTSDDFIVDNATITDLSDSMSVAFDYFLLAPISDGIVTVSIPDSVVTDWAGNYNNASEVYSFISDRTPPTAIMSSSLTSPTNTSPIPISITFSEPVRGFTADSISVENGSASNLTGSDLVYAFDITPAFTDTITISFSEGSVTDSANNDLIVDDFSIFYYTYPKVLSMTPDVSTLTWKDTEFQFTISDRLDPATVTEDNITISSLHSSGLNPAYTYSDTSRALTITLASSFVAVDSVSITLKGSLANIYGYGFDGDGDGVPGDDYIKSYKVAMLGDYDTSDTLDLIDLAALVQGFKDKDYSYELAPFTGSVPHFIPLPDSSYDIEDLMAFGMTWNWQASLSRSLFRQWQDEGEEITIETAHDLISINIPVGIVAYELQISYDPSQMILYSPENTGDINLTDNDKISGIYTLLAMTEGKLAVPITISGREADILLSFRAVGQDGEIISQLTRQLSLSAIPKSFALHQAYPNPFNPTTTIQFDLPEDINVLLEVYDISGRLIDELNNRTMQAGYHSITWNATMYSSGIYFVKLHAGKFHRTQKLMLIK